MFTAWTPNHPASILHRAIENEQTGKYCTILQYEKAAPFRYIIDCFQKLSFVNVRSSVFHSSYRSGGNIL
jgi:hypothetical protein